MRRKSMWHLSSNVVYTYQKGKFCRCAAHLCEQGVWDTVSACFTFSGLSFPLYFFCLNSVPLFTFVFIGRSSAQGYLVCWLSCRHTPKAFYRYSRPRTAFSAHRLFFPSCFYLPPAAYLHCLFAAPAPVAGFLVLLHTGTPTSSPILISTSSRFHLSPLTYHPRFLHHSLCTLCT
jgi:hypothetical protein